MGEQNVAVFIAECDVETSRCWH